MENDPTMTIFMGVIIVGLAAAIIIGTIALRKIAALERAAAKTNGILAKMQNTMRVRSDTDALVQNAEIIYQDLLSSALPLAAAAESTARNSAEHPLWQTLGGIMDEYGKNPYVLESLRRAIKLDPGAARAADAFLLTAEKLLVHITAVDSDGMLAATFTNGLLGQSMTLISQAKQLANN